MRLLAAGLLVVGCAAPRAPDQQRLVRDVASAPAPVRAEAEHESHERAEPFLLARLPKCWHEALVLDEGAAYVACQEGDVYAAPFGGVARRLASGTLHSSHPLAVDATWLFYMSNATEISAVPKQGGPSTVFHKGLQAVALQLDGVDVIVSAFQHGIVRIPIATAVPQMLVPIVSPDELAVGGGAIYFLDQVGEQKHLVQSLSPATPSTDLGTVPWWVQQLALAGDHLFAGLELELSTKKRRLLPEDLCGAFVTDGRFVFAACSGVVLGREVTGTKWRHVADVLVQDTLGLSATHLCWMDRDFDHKASSIQCITRPSDLR